MKYIKKFQTNADYQTFKNGSDYVTPNVSVIVEDDTIMFNPLASAVSLITFTVDAISYSAEEGMTWKEWCNSEYNTGGFIYDLGEVGDAIYTSDYNKYFIHPIYEDDLVTVGQYVTKKVAWPMR